MYRMNNFCFSGGLDSVSATIIRFTRKFTRSERRARKRIHVFSGNETFENILSLIMHHTDLPSLPMGTVVWLASPVLDFEEGGEG